MNTIHFGVLRERDGATVSDLPRGFRSNADSFLVWGEFITGPEDDLTVHFTYTTTTDSLVVIRDVIPQLRVALTQVLKPGARLIDYVVVTDYEDWSERVRIWLLDGTMSVAS